LLNNAVLFERPKKVSFQAIDTPGIRKTEILVKTAYCGLCGTDVHLFDGDVPFAKYPLVPGHEFSGEVTKIGSKVRNDLKVGDKVSINPNLSCRDFNKSNCYYCRKKRENFCESWEAIGVTRNGAFSEYVVCPSTSAYKIPENISLKEAAFMEPLACCLHGLRKVDLTASDVVLLIGSGPIGLLMLLAIKTLFRSKIIVSEPMKSRRDLALSLGADIAVNPLTEPIHSIVNSETSNNGVDVSIECVGSISTSKEAMDTVNKGGRVLIFGVAKPSSNIYLDIHKLYSNEISVFGSFTNPYENLNALDLLSQKKFSPLSLISHEFPLEKTEEAIKLAKKTNKDEVNKIMIKL
jgi:2-desacetyl-2-hydroxyethyl bacteriochlorophyllide A dehydrogenase